MLLTKIHFQSDLAWSGVNCNDQSIIQDSYVTKQYLHLNFEFFFIFMGFFLYRRFFKDMQHNALEKKSNMEYLEKEIGLKRFLPKTVIDEMKVCVNG